ncbi:MAG TPA: hypothetical protein VHE61_21950 [Opitutaceae bacterium]|nr:hypothetical protein [Opitutaceae bacterium]
MNPDRFQDRDGCDGRDEREVAPSAACLRKLKRMRKQELLAKLEEIELRLGTAAERPRDFICARAIAHQINNVLTSEQFGNDPARADPNGDQGVGR